jgi:hypothetical protein
VSTPGRGTYVFVTGLTKCLRTTLATIRRKPTNPTKVAAMAGILDENRRH